MLLSPVEFRYYRRSDYHNPYFSDIWNVLDFISLSSILVAYVLRTVQHINGNSSYTMSTAAMAIVLLFAYPNTLFFMQGLNQNSGELVRMIIGIVKGVRYSMFIQLVVAMGFFLAFYILYDAGP